MYMYPCMFVRERSKHADYYVIVTDHVIRVVDERSLPLALVGGVLDHGGLPRPASHLLTDGVRWTREGWVTHRQHKAALGHFTVRRAENQSGLTH